MSTRKNSWRSNEVKILKTLYFMGASDDDISTVLTRTSQSINKKITRLNIRPKNTSTHIIKPGRYIPAFATRHDLLKSMQKIFQNVNSEDSDQDLLHKYPLKKIRKVQADQIEKEEKKDSEEKGQWRSLKEVIAFLRHHNYSVVSLKDSPECLSGYTHILKDKKVTPTHLLIEANKIQHKLGEPLFYLEETTEE
ncbi:MAG: hypothetical protein GW748_03330 [Alphaproteobacteria bacterium]|nr:hypothetical protein [Alphaproteobacteria bacterium]NCQ66757.1 hypothetical protein [Alphaproteobacteria bacterium]NCT07208.1 hypothetical protein [Alphaproteobacteria bacterium]